MDQPKGSVLKQLIGAPPLQPPAQLVVKSQFAVDTSPQSESEPEDDKQQSPFALANRTVSSVTKEALDVADTFSQLIGKLAKRVEAYLPPAAAKELLLKLETPAREDDPGISFGLQQAIRLKDRCDFVSEAILLLEQGFNG